MKKLAVVSAVFCFCVAMFGLAPSMAAEPEAVAFRVPAEVFAGEPRGPYDTGTFEALWTNDALDDPSTADPHDKRKVIVQVWYPATLPARPRWAPYAISPQLYAKDHWVRRLAHVKTRSALDAPLAAQSARFPVLVYNHGRGQPHFSATFQTEFLASYGYVVVSIGHPGANGLERFPDGTPYENDGAKWMAETPGREDGRMPGRDGFEYMWAHSDLSLYVQDISFVLDSLAALDADPKHRFYRRLDLERVGSLGWSMGGFVSLQATRDEPRIKAAANLDGWPYGLMGPNGAVTRGSARPVLLMFGESADGAGGEVDVAQVEARQAADTYYLTLLRRSTADWYRVTVARTDHDHFSDHPLFEAPIPRDLHPRAAHAIINGYVLEFFDKYVRGGDARTPLLSGEKSFPEATLLRRGKVGNGGT